jgi:response regulator NasT
MRMPEMSGLEVARALNATGRVPFVFLSAFGDEEMVHEAAESGALGYLVKPVDIPQLVPFIEAAMARGREIDQLRSTAEQLEQALRIEQKTRTAVGIIMERKGLVRQEAFDLLRARARARRRKIGEVAEELIAAVEDMNLALREP